MKSRGLKKVATIISVSAIMLTMSVTALASDAMKSKWDTLTNEQKEELYELSDQKSHIDSQIIDKYLEFGVIDSETAATMKQNLETKKSDMRTNGRMPKIGGKGKRGNKTTTSNEKF